MKKELLLIFMVLLNLCCKTAIGQNSVEHPILEEEVFFDYSGEPVIGEAFTSYVENKMDSLKIPGVSMAIINKGHVSYHRALGLSDKEKAAPVTERTIFEAASISKSVFAFFVMTFVEEGKLNLDKPLYEYLPYPDIEHDERYKKITARMVLSHRSGFPNWRENEKDGQLRIYFEPGTDYLYSGEGYDYLAMVLKHIEQTDWNGLEKIFQEKVAQPLGLEHTVFIQTPHTLALKAAPYDEDGNLLSWEKNYWNLKSRDKFIAASSLHTEALELSRWMIAVMEKELLSMASYEELFKVHSPNTTGDIYSYTLGFSTVNEPEHQIYFHNGNNTGFTSMYLIDIKKKWGIVLFTNSEKAGPLFEELFFGYLAKEDKG